LDSGETDLERMKVHFSSLFGDPFRTAVRDSAKKKGLDPDKHRRDVEKALLLYLVQEFQATYSIRITARPIRFKSGRTRGVFKTIRVTQSDLFSPRTVAPKDILVWRGKDLDGLAVNISVRRQSNIERRVEEFTQDTKKSTLIGSIASDAASFVGRLVPGIGGIISQFSSAIGNEIHSLVTSEVKTEFDTRSTLFNRSARFYFADKTGLLAGRQEQARVGGGAFCVIEKRYAVRTSWEVPSGQGPDACEKLSGRSLLASGLTLRHGR